MERFAIDSETDLPILLVELACCRKETRETKKKAVRVNLSRDRSSYPWWISSQNKDSFRV